MIDDIRPLAKAIWKSSCVGREGYCSSDLQEAALSAIGYALKRGFNDGWLQSHKRLNFGYQPKDIEADWNEYAQALMNGID